MAEIHFLPVCTSCRKIIMQEVNYKEYTVMANSNLSLYTDRRIKPERCPHCGAVFTMISIPTKLPFAEETSF